MMNNKYTKDKEYEYRKTEYRSSKILAKKKSFNDDDLSGSQSIEILYRPPYQQYEKLIKKYINSHHRVLELGSGTGGHTITLLETGAHVTATDISPKALEVLSSSFSKYSNLKTQIADIEQLPFNDYDFDIICCASSLSYGDTKIVQSEIKRLLKPKGLFICIDSLNNNLVYKLHRYILFLMNKKSHTAILNMPTIKKIDSYCSLFTLKEIYFYGSILWLISFFKSIINQSILVDIIQKLDNFFKVKGSAHKFVIVLENKINHK